MGDEGSRQQTGHPLFHRFSIGAIDACVLSDGPIPLPVGGDIPLPDLLEIHAGLDPAVLRATLAAASLSPDTITIAQNILLAEIAGELVLFDTGCGESGVFGPHTGQLLKSLGDAGVRPGDVDALVFTHAHPDHCWGTIKADGTPAFPRARLLMSEAEFDFWTRRPAADQDAGTAGFRRHILPLRDRLRLFADGDEILPGVAALATPGHTPGHCSFMLRSQGEELCLVADVLLHHAVSFAHPAEPSAFDADPAQAVRTRLGLLDTLARSRIRVLGYHMPWPGLGYVEQRGPGFAFVPDAMSS